MRMRPPSAVAAKDQLAKLQGTWKVVSLEKRGESVAEIVKLQLQFTFQDQSLTVTAAAAPGFTPQQRIVRIGAAATPKLLDLAESDKAFDEHRDVIEGVYSLDGDSLQWCFNLDGDRPAKANRPAALESKADSNAVLLKLERVKSGTK